MRFIISASAFVLLASCEADVQASNIEQPIYYRITDGVVEAQFDTEIWPAAQVTSGFGDLCMDRQFGEIQYDFSQDLAYAKTVCLKGGEISFGQFEGSQSPVRGLNMKRVR